MKDIRMNYIYDFIYRNNEIQYGKKIFAAVDFMKFKYLIDIRGFGWTDRVKYLLGMKRVLLLIERPYKEYYYDWLEPMKHYVPVKEDMSDLIDKIRLLEDNPDLYDYIAKCAFDFVRTHFSKNNIQKMLMCQLFNK